MQPLPAAADSKRERPEKQSFRSKMSSMWKLIMPKDKYREGQPASEQLQLMTMPADADVFTANEQQQQQQQQPLANLAGGKMQLQYPSKLTSLFKRLTASSWCQEQLKALSDGHCRSLVTASQL